MAGKEILVKKYVVKPSGEERERLEVLIRRKGPGATAAKGAHPVEGRCLCAQAGVE
jgi:hypothetical protein